MSQFRKKKKKLFKLGSLKEEVNGGVNSFTLRISWRFKGGVGDVWGLQGGVIYLFIYFYFFFQRTLRSDEAQLRWRRGRIYAPRSSARTDGCGDKRESPHCLTEAGRSYSGGANTNASLFCYFLIAAAWLHRSIDSCLSQIDALLAPFCLFVLSRD